MEGYCYNRYNINGNSKGKKMAKTAMIRYSSETDEFNQAVINSDDSFVIIGDKEVTEVELEKMVDWEDVYGWVKTDA